MVVALGDFNAKIGKVPGLESNHDTTNSNTGLFKAFIKAANLTILNTLPIAKGLFTHFMEREGLPPSESILDYGLSDAGLILYISNFVIDEEARVSCGSDHALLVATIDCQAKKCVSTQFSEVLNFQLPPDKNYKVFNETFNSHPDLPNLETFSSLSTDEMASVLTSTLFDSCYKTFLPPKKKKPKRKRWLPPHIIKHIKLRRFLLRRYRIEYKKNCQDPTSQNFLSHLYSLVKKQRMRVKTLLGEFNLLNARRVRNRMLKNDTKLNNFWKFVRQHNRAVQNISAAYNDEGNVVFDRNDVSSQVIKT